MGDGFVELDGQNLGRKSSIGLVFATTQPDALLLFSDPYKMEVTLIESCRNLKFAIQIFNFVDWPDYLLHSFSAQRSTAR